MTAQVDISADLRFSIELPGRPAITGTVTGARNRIEVRLNDPTQFAAGRDAARLRAFAATLAGAGVTVVVVAGDLVLLEVGKTDAGWWQRRLLRSPHLRVASIGGVLVGARGRLRRSGAVLPGSELLPPTTLWPLTPTLGRSTRRPTTTHDPRRGGNPRLALTVANRQLPESRAVVFPLRGEVTTIGSAPDCDIRLTGLDPIHAVVVHDENDEFVLQDRSTSGTFLNGARREAAILRTGARITLGEWSLAYRRAEYADHGRPYGGRVGGEIGYQKPQPAARHRGTRRPEEP